MRAALIAHKVIQVFVVHIRIHRHRHTIHVIQVVTVVAKQQFGNKRLARRRFAAQQHVGRGRAYLFKYILHGAGHPRAGRGRVAVLAAIAEVRVAAVVLVEYLGIVHACLRDLARLAHGDFGGILAHRAHVVAVALRGADAAVYDLALG